MSQPRIPVGGLWTFYLFLGNLVPDHLFQGILEVGYKIPFSRMPGFSGICQILGASKYASMLLEEVSTLLQNRQLNLSLRMSKKDITLSTFLF
jgi:hypothetical protein